MLRQAIELRIKNCLGLNIAYDKKTGKAIKLTPDHFLDFVISCEEIDFPVKKSAISKVHSLTNAFIVGIAQNHGKYTLHLIT